jgi:hypothetical protein
MPVDYKDGKIYKIVCRKTGEVYVGGTAEKYLSQRLANHVRNFRHRDKGTKSISSYSIIERGDYYIELIENWPCGSVEELRQRERYWFDRTDCINKVKPYVSEDDHKERNRQYFQDNYEPSYGQALQKLFQDEDERKEIEEHRRERQQAYQAVYREENRDKQLEYMRQYYPANQEKIVQRARDWYQDNHDRAVEQRRTYRAQNKDATSKQQKEFYQQNREKIVERSRRYYAEHKERTVCDCGKEYATVRRAAHMKTKFHTDWIASQQGQIPDGSLQCECGVVVKKQSVWKHNRSEFHKKKTQ